MAQTLTLHPPDAGFSAHHAGIDGDSFEIGQIHACGASVE